MYLKTAWIIAFACLCSSVSANTIRFRTAVVDNLGNTISEIEVGSRFTLEVTVEDIRPEPTGAFSAYLDVAFDASLVAVDPLSLVHSSTFENGVNADFAPGLIDEAGGTGGVVPLYAGEFDLFSVEFVALNVGALEFLGDPADEPIQHVVTLYGQTTIVPDSEQVFVNGSLTIVPEPSNSAVMFGMLPALLFVLYRRNRQFAHNCRNLRHSLGCGTHGGV